MVGYAREQLVHVLAVIVKRRTMESDKKLLFDSVFGEVTQLLAMDPPKVTVHLCVYILIFNATGSFVAHIHEYNAMCNNTFKVENVGYGIHLCIDCIHKERLQFIQCCIIRNALVIKLLLQEICECYKAYT